MPGCAMSKTNWIDRDLIVGPYIALVQTEKQFHAAMSHCQIPKDQRGAWIKTPTANATMHWFDNPKGEQCCIVAVREKKGVTPVEICGLLVHEAVHIWQAFRERIGEDNPSKEFEAYAIQAISQRLMAAYKHKAVK